MVITRQDRVLRPLNYCIVDEVDSILIDEARTPADYFRSVRTKHG